MSTISQQSKIKTPKQEKPKNLIYLILKWLVIIAIALVILFLLSSPLRGKAASKYISRGDNYLSEKKYLSAELEYDKALTLSSGNLTARQRKLLADKASKNILELESYSNLSGFSALTNKIGEASAFPKNQSEAVKLSRKFIEEKEYQLAIIPAKTAIEMDKEYRDAWLYLGIANLKTAQLVELSPSVREDYLNKAKEAFNKTLALDPESQSAKDFLAEANNI